jgi:hypothetical protein
MSVASPSSVTLSTPVDQVRHRHRHYYGHYPAVIVTVMIPAPRLA